MTIRLSAVAIMMIALMGWSLSPQSAVAEQAGETEAAAPEVSPPPAPAGEEVAGKMFVKSDVPPPPPTTEAILNQPIGPINPYLDTAIPGVGAINPKIVEEIFHTDEELAGPITMELLVDMVFLLNSDLQAALPNDFLDQDDEAQFQIQVKLLVDNEYPALFLGLDRTDVVDRSYFARLLSELLQNQVACEASLREAGVITQPEGLPVTLTGEELVQCFVQEGLMESATAPLTGLEIRNILGDPQLRWRRAMDPGAAEVLAPFENSLEAVFVTPLSPDSPIQRGQQ